MLILFTLASFIEDVAYRQLAAFTPLASATDAARARVMTSPTCR